MAMTATEGDKILTAGFAPWSVTAGLSPRAAGEGRQVPRPAWSRVPDRGIWRDAPTAVADGAAVRAAPAVRQAPNL